MSFISKSIIHVKVVDWAIQSVQLTWSCGDIRMDIGWGTYANYWLEESWFNTWQLQRNVQLEFVVILKLIEFNAKS